MAWELLLWLFTFVAVISLIFLTAYQLICLSDLEFDYINPFDTSSRINAIVLPEFVVQGLLCIIFFLTWHWFPFLIMAPITYYHVKLYMKRRHLIDVTEIFRLLDEEKKYRKVTSDKWSSCVYADASRSLSDADLFYQYVGFLIKAPKDAHLKNFEESFGPKNSLEHHSCEGQMMKHVM